MLLTIERQFHVQFFLKIDEIREFYSDIDISMLPVPPNTNTALFGVGIGNFAIEDSGVLIMPGFIDVNPKNSLNFLKKSSNTFIVDSSSVCDEYNLIHCDIDGNLWEYLFSPDWRLVFVNFGVIETINGSFFNWKQFISRKHEFNIKARETIAIIILLAVNMNKDERN